MKMGRLQEKLAKNKKAPARHKAEESYLLTTKLYCGKCGALMFGESGVSHTGKMYTYYKCAAAKKKKTCDKKAVRKQWLEDLVVNETMKLVEDDASMNAIIAKVMELQNQESTDLPIYEKQLKETEVGITNMLNAIQMGILTSSTKERLEALEDQRKELQARIAEERLAKPKMKEEFVRFWLLRFRKLDMTQPEQRQALVDTFINAIYLYDDKVLITFNYKEGTETVAFGEAVKAEKSSDMSALGAFSTGVGSTDMAAGMVTGKAWFKVPSAIKVVITGKKAPCISGKDVVLHLIGEIGVDGALYKSLEFTGDGIKELSMDDRLCISNMAIECGAKNGIFPVDDITLEYVKGRSERPYEVYDGRGKS